VGKCPSCQLGVNLDVVHCPRFGPAVSASAAPALVDGRYAVESELGHGGMGIVYLARDVGLGRRVALKFLSPEIARDEPTLERFRREANALASIRHENVVQVYAFGRHEESFFFAMEYIAGKNLEEIVGAYTANRTFVSVRLAITILESVASGLDALHAGGLVHRDVKPANIVIEERTGRAVLLDLGLAKPLSWSATKTSTELSGSPPYMAPEQIRLGRSSEGPSSTVDIYSLGCTAYEILTGAPPYVGDSLYDTLHMHVTAPIPAASSVRAELRDLDRALATALAKDPRTRYASCGEFAAALRSAAKGFFSADATSLACSAARARVDGSLRLLIVDDDAAVRGVLARAAGRAFPAAKLEVAFAPSGEEALARVREMPPDLISLDYDMPGMNGVETLGVLRAQAGVERTPTIVVTGGPEDTIRWRFELLGVTEFLSKPLEVGAIVRALQQALGARAEAARPGATTGVRRAHARPLRRGSTVSTPRRSPAAAPRATPCAPAPARSRLRPRAASRASRTSSLRGSGARAPRDIAPG
jgi:eukaryotic-like serine/threonine-protein kinase